MACCEAEFAHGSLSNASFCKTRVAGLPVESHHYNSHGGEPNIVEEDSSHEGTEHHSARPRMNGVGHHWSDLHS